MGKGGEQSCGKTSKSETKLKHLTTEELKQWANAYGVDSEKDRSILLRTLVKSHFRFSFICLHM